MAESQPELEPYQVLGVSPHSSRAEVARAYKILAQIFHPDRFADSPAPVRQEAEHRMRSLNEAYALARQGRLVRRQPVARARNGTTPAPSSDARAPASAGVPWDVVIRQRAAEAARANATRRAREREATNGVAVARPRPRGGCPLVLTGLGLARHTGNIVCCGCGSIQWLPEGWREHLDTTIYHCSICDRLLLAR